MKIVISGVNTQNKGAELMLYAILQQIEKRYPNADVYANWDWASKEVSYIQTPLKLHNMPFIERLKLGKSIHLPGILMRLGFGGFYKNKPIRNADYLFDASGFKFSDQMLGKRITSEGLKKWENELNFYKSQGTKVIFLPQAFGPVKEQNTRKLLSYIDETATVVMPREKVSLQYLQEADMNMQKVKMFTDFTSLVHGSIPERYQHLQGALCVIPNKQMVNKGVISEPDYIDLMSKIIDCAKKRGITTYLLNHANIDDENYARMIQKKVGENIEVVSGLNALEVKGMISSAYMCISSRFHGVASSLNSCVPCLATSWSHKYAELYADYGLSDCVLDINNIDSCISQLEIFLSKEKNEELKKHLQNALPTIQQQVANMWDYIWSL